MDKKREIYKKYNMFLRVKKMIIILGIISSISLVAYFVFNEITGGKLSILMLIASIVSITLFLLLWVSLIPMKKHILSLIEESGK